ASLSDIQAMFRNASWDARHIRCFWGRVLGPEIIAHSIGMILLLRNVIVPPSTGNFSIPCAVDGMTRIFLIPGQPIIPLCWDGDLTTMKFIHAEVECPSSPIFTSRDIWPSGQMVSPLNPVRCDTDWIQLMVAQSVVVLAVIN
ncbi:hypothetical protein Tco_0049513, partial [Tanacetum coccineum]